MGVFSYYFNPQATTTVYEETGYRSRPGSTGSRFHHVKEGPSVMVSGMPLSVVIEQPEAAAPPAVPALSWLGYEPAMVDLAPVEMIPSGPIPGNSS
jgi:hypothetical protein